MEWKDSMKIKDSKISFQKEFWFLNHFSQYKNIFHYKEDFPWMLKLQNKCSKGRFL